MLFILKNYQMQMVFMIEKTGEELPNANGIYDRENW